MSLTLRISVCRCLGLDALSKLDWITYSTAALVCRAISLDATAALRISNYGRVLGKRRVLPKRRAKRRLLGLQLRAVFHWLDCDLCSRSIYGREGVEFQTQPTGAFFVCCVFTKQKQEHQSLHHRLSRQGTTRSRLTIQRNHNTDATERFGDNLCLHSEQPVGACT